MAATLKMTHKAIGAEVERPGRDAKLRRRMGTLCRTALYHLFSSFWFL